MESDYDRKFEEMKKYIPFLESMIRRLENTSTGSINPRQAQLSKIRALRDLLLDRNKRMKMENLLKCEQVLVNLYSKVESRDTLPGIQKAPQSVSSTRQTKSPPNDLETVRRKLKAVQENEETLPEIARANQTEVDCTPGSKEPALFQRRPNKASPPTQITTRNQPSCSRRSYTRVLVSPPPSDRRWATSEDHITPDNHLFHRRSPKKSPNKKDRKKSSKHDRKSTRSDNNLNITLNVPEESINSLNTEDIFDRIINCDNTDVDIGTLRDLRSQILSELKQTGTNEDISDLILKSYRNKSNKSQRNPDVEEGELSDSESEVIENVYGSLVIADGDKQSGKCKETTASSKDPDICADPRKIQIHLVISNSNNEKTTENPSTSKVNEKTNPIFNDQNKSSIHSEKGFKLIKQAINISSDNFNSSTETKLNSTNDDLIADEAPSVTVSESPKTSYILDLAEKSPETETVEEKITKNASSDEIVEKTPSTKQIGVTKIAEPTNNKNTDNKGENKANFYKPIVEPDAKKPENMELKGSEDAKTTLAPGEYLEKLLSPTDSKENTLKDKQADLKSEESVQIPFLSEPSNVNPSKESKNVVSEIDILQALKNEILNETIAIPGTEIVTPALHQPKVTKVANAHEIAVKRKISLENYKKKSEQKKPLYIKETPLFGSKKRDDVPQVPSRGLTTKELERFNLAHLALDDSSDEEEQKTKGKENEDNISIDDIYGDLAPRSPDAEILLKIGKESPVIIPEEPVEAPVVESKADVDMRTFIPMVSPQNTKCSPMASNEPAPYKPPKPDTNRSINEPSLPRPCDPRKRKDNFNPSLNNNHSSSLQLFNPGGTPRPMSNFANMTPSRTPNMIPSMTPSRMQNMTPNARTFEMTPSHSFEVDDQSTKRKHVYAPVMWDTCDKDTTQETSSPRWENNETHSGSTIREGQSKQMSTRWGDRDPRSSCVAKDETCDNRDNYQQRRDPRLNNERWDDGYLRSECPRTPSHYFGRGEYPSTPSHTFGRAEGPMTPVHPFGRSDKPPTTPSHPFGSGESPSTPSHQFGRSDMPMTPSHPFGRSDCPNTPSHPFGRIDCPNTPSHPFGRTDCSTTPSHPFGRSDYPTTSHTFSRSDCPGTPSHPFGRSEGYPQDPRYNRGGKYDHEDDRNYSRDRNAPNYNRSNSYGSDKLNRYSGTNEGHLRFGRERSVGRNDPDRYNREHSVGINDQNRYIYDPSEGRRPNKRDTSVGRTREPSVGRVREPSIGRVRESCFGRVNRVYDDLPCSKDNQKGRRSCNESRFDHVPNRSFTEVGTRRERSIGRTMPSKQIFSGSSTRASSINRTSHEMLADNTVSVESHAGRSFTIDTSINATFQEFNFADEASRVFDARRKRAASVGRSLNRESSLSRSMEPDGVIRHERTYISNKNTSKFSRACSVGRDLASCRPERSLKEIKADLETFKTNVVIPKKAARGKSVDKSCGRDDAIALKKNIADTKTVDSESKKAPIRSSSRDPKSRKEMYDAHKQKTVSSSKKDAYSPRKNIRDPRMRHEKHTTSTKYKIDQRHRNQYDNKFYGIVYTNEAIAKGNILGPGYGVKNYKIPKIKRPPEESTEKEPDMFQSDNEKEKDPKEIKVDTSTDNKNQETDSKSKKQVKGESDVKTKISKSKAGDLQNFIDVSPIRTRRTCKSAIVYSDIDSDSNERTEDKMATENASPIKTKTIQKYDKKSIPQAKDIESNDNDSLDFTFDIQDEDIDLFNENIASDTVIDNINDLIADLDKDIGTTKSNESMITKLTKDSIIENILESLSSADSTNLVSENIQDESLKKQVLATVGNADKSKLNAKKEQEQNNMNETENICKEIIHHTVSEMSDIINERNVDEKIKSPSAIVEKPNETTQKEILMPLPQASKEDNFQTVSTSIPEENSQNSGEIIEQSPYENSEVCSTPDSTINTEGNFSENKSFHEKPDSTISAQTEMNSDISSTHEHTEVPCKEVTAETNSLSEAAALKSDSLGSILSLLKDKSKIKELLSMLDDQSDNEKLKKKLEKLSEIVSDDEDSAEKSNIIDKETTDNKVQLDSKPETTPVDPQKDKNQSESVINKPEKPMDIEDNVGEIEPSQVDQPNIEKGNKNSEAKEDETNEKEDTTQNNDNAKVSSSDDEGDNEPIVKRSQSCSGKKIIGKGRKARWPNWAKKLNKLKVQANKEKRVTRSETVTPQAKRCKKRKCEVQSLQEDVKDMFMSGGVLNETGIRMCRLAKLVDEKSNNQSNESSPTKTNESGDRSDADLRDNTEPGPVVVLEKFSTKKLEHSLPKPPRKKPGPKPKSKPATEKPLDTKTTEKPQPTQAYKPGPKSKTKVLASQKCDPYEFKENDSISESTIKTSENTPFNSDSDSESLNSSKSFGSMELLAEKKQKSKKRKNKWQMGVIKSKKSKKNANKASPRPPVERDPTPELIVATPNKKFPDMDCFTDKSYCFVKSSSTYACRLCEFEGESIVHHYKKQHPHYEIPLSRMHPRTAFDAIKQSMTTNFQEISNVPVAKYVCRFCMMIFDDKRKAILEEFFWHVVSMHTGEYKQLCSECLNIKKCTFMLDIPPPPKDLKGLLMGYICGKCNYTQVSLENLKNHVSLRHNDEETEVYTISLGVMTQKMVETLKMLAIEESPRTTRSLRSNNSSNIDEKSATEVETQRKRRPRGPRSVQSKIQFESETVSDESEDTKLDMKREKVAEESKDTQNLVSSLGDPIDDHIVNADPEPDKATLETAAMESIQNNSSLDVFVESHFKINYTETGNKEYLCCINGHDHYTTSLLISMKKHVQTKHTLDVWDGYCSVCKVIVMSQGIHKFKDCLSHFLDKHPDNFPVLEKTTKDVVTAPAELVRTESPKTYIQVRPLSELISNQSQSGSTETQQEDLSIALPKIESVVSLNIDAISNPSVVEQPQENPIADTNNYDEPAVPLKEIIEINYEEAQKEVMSKKHRIVLDMMMTPDKLTHVFKCAGRYCSFTCASTEDALVHASTHQRVGGKDALICLYCSFDAAGNAIDLVSHVFKEHGACQFCCKSCFYRAITSTLVEAHYIRMHGVISPGVVLQATIITSFLKRADESEGLLSRQEAVKHYVCCSDAGRCKFKTFTPGKFMEHLSQRHPDVQCHDCNECPYIATSTMDLLQHLQSHGLKLYQCTWCIFGADTENEMLGHASIKHPMKRPQAYLRHIIESKDGTSTAKFKVLPFVHITKKTAIAPVEVPLGAKPDNPVREAERALELEKLIGHTDQMIQNFNSELISSPIQSRVTVLQEEEELIDSESVPSTSRLEDQATQQLEDILEPPRQATPTPLDRETPVSEQATPQLKMEAVEKIPTEENDAALTQNRIVSGVIYCLDSDEEDSNQGAGVIDLSDDNDSNIGPSPPVVKTTATDKGPMQRFPWLQLFKCSKCNTTFKTGHGLKRHYQCCFPNSFDVVSCPYCPYKTEDKNKIINHYTNQHGQLDRYTCGICKQEETSSKLIRKHFGTVHGLNKLVFKMQNKSSHSIEYLVDALDDKQKTRGRRKRSNNDPPIGAPPAKVRRYGPGDVSFLPINQIFDELAQCSLCEFSTKVRQNLIRHLQLHSQQQSVPEIAPVNPVPHLETNEMHFDRMLNLASSSISNKTTEKSRPEPEPVVAVHIPPEAAARYPIYIPERQRYACGTKDCSYISIDEAMLKCHWETLHSGSNDYHCVHCPETQQVDTSKPLTASRIIGHLKMHDVRLFACSACAYYHYQQHIVDKHLIEKHNGNAQLKVVRGPSAAPQPLVSSQSIANAPTMDLKPWQCGLCKFKSMLRPEVIDHCSKHHQSKFQYKCAFCPWRSSTLENVTKHHSNSHLEQRADVFYFYYREGSISDEPDGTPRWMKQRLKAGLPEEHEVKTETEPPASEAPTVSTPITIQPPPGVSVDLNIVKSEIPEPESPKQDQGTIKDLCMKFGSFCDPNGIRYKCSLCKQTMEDTREAMQSHLYEELKYRKWGCRVCSYRAFHKKGLKEHAFHEHRKNLEPVEMSSDKQIETWVTELLDHQENIIKKNLTDFQNQKILTTEKKQVSMSQLKEKETISTIDKLPAGESYNISKQELTKQLGPFGEPKYLMFCCPKCDDQIKEESKMNEHLEMELSKVRWCCSNCPVKFQNYHQAQLHCRTVHIGQSAKAVEAVRDPKIRSAWIAAVIQAQKLNMNIMPITSVTSAPTKSAPPAEKEPEQEPAENSLLVVRYEENVPNPETSKPQEIYTRRKRPVFMDSDDEDERLVIDEEPEKKTDTVSGVKCPYCECRTTNRSTLNDHILRHYNLKPYRCAYCDFNAYNQTMYKHIEKKHPGMARNMTKVKVPDTPPIEINITLGRGGPTKRKSKDLDAVFCLYCEATFPESNTHTHPNREPQFAGLGENVLKCNHCVTLRKDLVSMKEHYKFNHPSTSLDISQYVIKEDRESHILCTTKRCRKLLNSLDELKTHHEADHAGQQLRYRVQTVGGQYQAVPIEGQNKLDTFEIVDLIDDAKSSETSVAKRKSDYPVAGEPQRFAKKSTTKLPFTNAIAKKSTTKLPFYEELSESDEEEYSYYGTKPPCLDGYANISTLMSSSEDATPLPVTLPALRAIVDIAPKVVVKDIKKTNIEVKI